MGEEIRRRLGVRSDKQGAGYAVPRRQGRGAGRLEFGIRGRHEQAYFAVSDVIGGGEPGGLHAVKSARVSAHGFTPPRRRSAARSAAAIPRSSPLSPSSASSLQGRTTAASADSRQRMDRCCGSTTRTAFPDGQRRPREGRVVNGPGPTNRRRDAYINSGYGALGGRPGNSCWRFGVSDDDANAEAAEAQRPQRT